MTPFPSAIQTRKRTRLDSLENSGPPEKYQAMTQRLVHDDSYYFEDGSCVLLVGDILFNVPPAYGVCLCSFLMSLSHRSIALF